MLFVFFYFLMWRRQRNVPIQKDVRELEKTSWAISVM